MLRIVKNTVNIYIYMMNLGAPNYPEVCVSDTLLLKEFWPYMPGNGETMPRSCEGGPRMLQMSQA